MDRFRAVAGEQREMVHLARRAGLDDEARCDVRSPLLHQMLVDGRSREQRGNRQHVAPRRLRSDMMRML